jgi:hypothetical protein
VRGYEQAVRWPKPEDLELLGRALEVDPSSLIAPLPSEFARIPRDVLDALAHVEPHQLELIRGQLAVFARNRELEALARRSSQTPQGIPKGGQLKKQGRKKGQ